MEEFQGVTSAIKTARRWKGGDFDRAINWTVQNHPQAGADPEVLSWILRSAENGEASDTTVQSTSDKGGELATAQQLLAQGNDLLSSGINGERGSAYEALANILWECEQTLTQIVGLLERQVASEPLGSVGTCMARTINSVSKYNPDKAFELLVRLLGSDVRIVGSRAAQDMLNWAAHGYGEVVAGIADRLLASESEGLRAHGHFLESLLALLSDDRNSTFVAGFGGNPLRRQMAAYRGAGNVAVDRHYARTSSWLVRLFSDEELRVRRDTVQIAWGELLDGAGDHSSLVTSYLSSPAFEENSDYLMRALEVRVSRWPVLTFDAVEKALVLAGEWSEEHRQGHFSTMHHLSKVLVEIYRSVAGGSDRERKILDLFDVHLAQDSYDLRGQLGVYERH